MSHPQTLQIPFPEFMLSTPTIQDSIQKLQLEYEKSKNICISHKKIVPLREKYTERSTRRMTGSELLNIAQANKKDEFYTQLADIEAELRYYKKYFKGKIVYCNCDDSEVSNFTKFFINHFQDYKIKKLISTCYKPLSQFNETSIPTYIVYDGTPESLTPMPLKGNGDFRSDECVDFLQQADVVVTNPPFSLFREFVKLLYNYQKDFLIIGNVNAISYKECFKHILNNEMWLGQSIHSGDREFQVPQDYPLEAANFRIDANGNKFIRVKGVRWFTNIDCDERYKHLPLTSVYSPEKYPKFDNIDAINVGKTKDIPRDYKGIMGVPITFIDWYNPNQFEIVGNEYTLNIAGGRGYVNGKRLYSRIFIRKV